MLQKRRHFSEKLTKVWKNPCISCGIVLKWLSPTGFKKRLRLVPLTSLSTRTKEGGFRLFGSTLLIGAKITFPTFPNFPKILGITVFSDKVFVWRGRRRGEGVVEKGRRSCQNLMKISIFGAICLVYDGDSFLENSFDGRLIPCSWTGQEQSCSWQMRIINAHYLPAINHHLTKWELLIGNSGTSNYRTINWHYRFKNSESST